MAAGFGKVGRGKVNSNAFGGQGKPKRVEGTAYTFAAFAHGVIGQANNLKSGKPRGYLYLNIYRNGVYTGKGNCSNVRNLALLLSHATLKGVFILAALSKQKLRA